MDDQRHLAIEPNNTLDKPGRQRLPHKNIRLNEALKPPQLVQFTLLDIYMSPGASIHSPRSSITGQDQTFPPELEEALMN